MIGDEIKYKYCNSDPSIMQDLVVAIYENAMHDYIWSIKTLSRLLYKKKCNLSKDNLRNIMEAERLMHDVDVFLSKAEYNISAPVCKAIKKKLHEYLDGHLMVYDYVYGRGEIWKDYQERLSGKRPRKLEVRSTQSHS